MPQRREIPIVVAMIMTDVDVEKDVDVVAEGVAEMRKIKKGALRVSQKKA